MEPEQVATLVPRPRVPLHAVIGATRKELAAGLRYWELRSEFWRANEPADGLRIHTTYAEEMAAAYREALEEKA